LCAACTQPKSSRETDADGDGYAAANDCDDGDAAINPGAAEVCDGVDNNCDGAVDDADVAVDASSLSTWYADTDGDTYGDAAASTEACAAPSGAVADGTDCDDGNGAINPGAPEACDDIDNNCNGAIDDADSTLDPTLATRWYADSDTDAYGDPDSFVDACIQPADTVTDSADCDDGDGAVNPDATEVCDGIDNDCDGAIDDGDDSLDLTTAATWYADTDSDGYGDPDSPVLACVEPTDAVADDTDCDDGDGAINPGAAEVENDGLDNDCDSTTADVSGGGTFDTSASVANIQGNYAFGNSGSSVSSGDLNNDGTADLFLGAISGPSGSTTAHVVYGPFSGSSSVSDAEAEIILPATWGGGSAIFDANADGTDDLWVGEWDASTGGASYLFLGPVTGNYTDADADAVVYGSTSDGRLGWFMHAEDDMTGDGLPDVVMGNYAASGAASRGGAAWVFSGAPSGNLTVADADGGLVGSAFFDVIGYQVSGGDVNGDGINDLVTTGTNGYSGTPGSAYVLFGPVTSVVSRTDADMQVNSTSSNAFGISLTASSDLNGDGYDDIVVGAYTDSGGGTTAGAAYVFLGDPAGATGLSEATADATLYGGSGQYLGVHLHGLGDWEGDGYGDLVVSSMYAASGQDDGAAYLFRGPLTGSVSLSDAFILVEGVSSDRSIASDVTTLPDQDGDGREELVLAAPATSAASLSTSGKTYIFHSSDL
jgi:hypothetical protein